jgi:hypothetical protein
MIAHKRLFGCTLAIICLGLGNVRAEGPNDPDVRAKIIGSPKELSVKPDKVTLTGPRASAQLVVTGIYADGSVRDLTHFADVKIDGADPLVAIDGERLITPKKNGTTNLMIGAGGQTAKLAVVVQGLDKPEPVSFRNEVVAALNVGGCNSGACHGTPNGKNGFKLSLRGYEPESDFIQLTRDMLARRTDRQNPDTSLVMLKALGRVAHEGGPRFPASSLPAVTLRTWIAEGLRDDLPTRIAVKRVEVLPGPRILNSPCRQQQLAVRAEFSDGTVRDVTRFTVFTSNDPLIASVNSNGLVEFSQTGEVAILCRFLMQLVPVRLTYLEPKPGFQWSNPPESNFVDKHVFAKLKMLNILPSELCSDQEFIRRAYLDVCGVLPEPQAVAKFLASKDADKRAKLIDQLLDRPEYADFWTLKWSDVFRSNRKAIQVKGTHVFQKWLRGHIDKNTGFDQVIAEIITAGGSTYANPPSNYYRISRDPTVLAETTAQLFFGVLMQCAKCHNHPFERWTQDDYYSLAAFFSRVKLRVDPIEGGDPKKKDGAEYVYVERAGEMIQPRTNKAMVPKFLGGATPDIVPGHDRREALAKWLASPDNPFVPRSVVNRIWFHLMGRGIVDPVDDFRESNPSANDELLDALARDFVKHKFDAKHLIRTIMNSRTYQLSARTNEFNKDDSKYFSHAVIRLLTAEQLFDALCQVTEVPEKFAGHPLGTRAVQLPDGDPNHPFLKTFGQPARELACECERESESNLAQALQLINGPAVNDRLRNPNNRIGKLLAAKKSNKEILDSLYLVTLSRLPSEKEERKFLAHVNEATNPRLAWEDVHWALINSKAFLFRH